MAAHQRGPRRRRSALRTSLLYLALAGTALAVAPSQAATGTRDQFVQDYNRTVLNEDALRSGLGTVFQALPAEHQQILVGFLIDILQDPDFVDYFFAQLIQYRGAEMATENLALLGAGVSRAAYRAGLLRLSPEEQEAAIGGVGNLLDWLNATDPSLCARMAGLYGPPPTETEVDALEYRFYATISADQLRATLDLQKAAIRAEITGAPPATMFAMADLQRAQAAYLRGANDAARSMELTLPDSAVANARTPEAICNAGVVGFHAYEMLPQPERAWAIYGYFLSITRN